MKRIKKRKKIKQKMKKMKENMKKTKLTSKMSISYKFFAERTDFANYRLTNFFQIENFY